LKLIVRVHIYIIYQHTTRKNVDLKNRFLRFFFLEIYKCQTDYRIKYL